MNDRSRKSATRIKATALDKMQFLVDQYHDRQCRCVIGFDGKAELSLLETAVRLSMEVVPVLNCRFVNHSWRPYWEKLSSHNGRLPLRFIETEEAEHAVNLFLSEPMDCLKGPQLEVALIRSEYDNLCVKISHQVTDAAGLLDYIRILSGIYSRLENGDGVEPNDAPAGKRGLGQIFWHAGFRQVFKGLMNWNFPVSDWGFPRISSDCSGLAFPARSVGPECVASLKKYCHEHGIKLNVFLITAFFKTLTEILNPSPGARLSVQVTYDLRKYLPTGRAVTICDLSGVFFPVIRHVPGKDFETLMVDVEQVLSRGKNRHMWIGSAFFVEMMTLLPKKFQTSYARRVMSREISRGTSHPVFSNLGVIDPGIFKFNGLSVVDLGLFGPVAFPPDFLVTIYSFRERLYMNSSFCPTATDPLLVDRFFEKFNENLQL
jgi:NRPS condensation-like uncharacterized protein